MNFCVKPCVDSKGKNKFIYIQIDVMTLNTPCVLCLVNTLELIEIGIHTDRSSRAG